MKQLPLVLLFLVMACQPQVNKDKYIRISGKATAVPDGMVYLVKAGNWKSRVDSAKSVNGNFNFRIPIDSAFVPFATAIHFFTDGDSLHPVRLQYKNPFLQINGQPAMRDQFWLERVSISINGENKGGLPLQIKAGPETRLMMRHQFNDIGWMGDRDTVKRNEKRVMLQKEITQHPSSYFLLESIRRSKETYTKDELVSLLSLFNKKILASVPGKKLQEYLAVLPAPGSTYPMLSLKSNSGDQQAMLDTAARVNMLVFWASWCTPCRKEIPLLRKLYQQYFRKGLGMTSISIDLQTENWQQALEIEKMPWRQLVVNKDQIERIENIFRFTSIPFIVFTDKNGREIGRFADYDESAAGLYEELIKKHL